MPATWPSHSSLIFVVIVSLSPHHSCVITEVMCSSIVDDLLSPALWEWWWKTLVEVQGPRCHANVLHLAPLAFDTSCIQSDS